MISVRSVIILAATAFALAMLAAPNCPTCGQAVKPDALTKQQFDALPDSAVLDHNGARLIKGEFRTRQMKGQADAQARLQALAAQDRAKFQEYREKFLQSQQAKLQQKNATFRAEVARRKQALAAQMTPQHQALLREAFDLVGRARSAPPPERAQIDQRAAEIVEQLGGSPPAMPGSIARPMNAR